MMKKIAAAALVGCCAAAMSAGQVQAVEVLGEIDKKTTLVTLEAASEKKKKVLELGALRTGEARLPGGVISQKDRLRMRLEREAARQEEEKK